MGRERLADPLRGITAQCHDAANPGRLKTTDHRIDFILAGADTGQVRSGIDTGIGLDLGDHAQRALARRTAGAVGHRDKARLERSKLVDRVPEALFHCVGLGREEFKGKLQLWPRGGGLAAGAQIVVDHGHIPFKSCR